MRVRAPNGIRVLFDGMWLAHRLEESTRWAALGGAELHDQRKQAEFQEWTWLCWAMRKTATRSLQKKRRRRKGMFQFACQLLKLIQHLASTLARPSFPPAHAHRTATDTTRPSSSSPLPAPARSFGFVSYHAPHSPRGVAPSGPSAAYISWWPVCVWSPNR